MKDFMLLKILDRFQWAFKNLNIDYGIMRMIIQLKLTMDSRTVTNTGLTTFRSRSYLGGSGRKKDRNKSVYLIIGYFVIGIFSCILFTVPVNLSVAISIIITLFFVLLGTLLISNYSTVLLDTKDKNIILSKPVDSKTLSMARLIHLIYYLGTISIAMMIAPIVVMGFKVSVIGAIILFIEIFFLDIFIISIVSILYSTILKFFDGEKLKDIINIVQIALGILMFLFTQIAADFSNYIIKLNDFSFQWWNIILPSFWFESPFHLIEGAYETQYIIGTILAVIIPIILWIICRALMPSFEKNVSKLDEVSSVKINKHRKIKEVLSTLICRNKEERAFFNFSLQIMGNEREFKLKLYPIIGKSVIMPIVFIFLCSQSSGLGAIRRSGYLYLMFYFVTVYLVSYVYFIRYSRNYKASWVYFIMPIKDKSNSYSGALKAFVIKIVMPTVVISVIVMLAMFGIRVWPDVISFIIITIALIPLSYNIGKNEVLPFTVAFIDKKLGNGIGRIAITVLLLLIAAIQFSVSRFVPYGIFIFILLSLIFCYLSWKFSFKTQ